jgi:hypothetical protein
MVRGKRERRETKTAEEKKRGTHVNTEKIRGRQKQSKIPDLRFSYRKLIA